MNVGGVFFRLSTGLIILDVDRAFGQMPAKPVLIRPEEVVELRDAIVNHPIAPTKRAFLNQRLASWVKSANE